MFGKKPHQNSLRLPPIANADPQATEVLRVWAAPGKPQELTLRTTWKDPSAWGMMLVDIARHVSKAYAKEGHDPHGVLKKIYEVFEAERATPTDEPKDISNE